MTVIAVLGTGQMGAAMVRRLLASGHRVRVWNRTVPRTAALLKLGADVAASAAEAVGDADVVITMLTDTAAIDAVLFDTGAAARALRPGTCVVQMSTIGPTEVRELAKRLPAGVDLVDAPVGGSIDAAEAGRLIVLAGGEDSALRRVAPVLEVFGTVRRCGSVGGGAALKLILNTALVTSVAALADTMTLAALLGVKRDTAMEALAVGPLGGAVTRATSTSASFSIALAGKDLALALRELGEVPAPVAHAAAHALGAAPDSSADVATITSKERQCA